jgi:hypothetical protein
MKYIIVLSLDLTGPEELGEVVKKIDPTNVPGFLGLIRLAIDPVATQVEEWLDE